MQFELSGNAYPELDHTAPAAPKVVTPTQNFELSDIGTDEALRPVCSATNEVPLPAWFGAMVPVEDRPN